jgi:hypothetical protein
MTKFITPRTIIATAFAATAMASIALMGSARAGTAGNLHQCDSSDPAYTVQCCESLVRNKEADWIRNSGKGCKALTVCTGTFGKYKCTIKRRKPPTYCELHPKLCHPKPPTNCELHPTTCGNLLPKPKTKPTTNYCKLHPKACLPAGQGGQNNGGGDPAP